jgi:hypothetical protein
VAAIVELQATVAVPESTTLVGVIAPHVRFAVTESERATVPVNPFTPVMVIVDVEEAPTVTGAGDVAAIVKSLTVIVTVVEWLSAPLVPIIVRV